MRFCTEACFNFWTFGFYARCCAKKNSYERWLDRSLVWVGKPPSGFNNQFRIFDEKMKLCQKVAKFYWIFRAQVALPPIWRQKQIQELTAAS